MSARIQSAIDWAARLALRGVFRFLSPRTTSPVSEFVVHRILVAGSMGIGNAVMLEPLLRALRERFPDAHLAAAVRADAASLSLIQWPGLVDETVVVRGSSRLALMRAGLRLARGNWDLLVVRFNGAAYEIVTAATFGRIPYRLGHVSSGRFRTNVDWLFNLPVTMSEYDHEVDRYIALAQPLGVNAKGWVPSLRLSSEDREGAKRILRHLGVSEGSVVAIQPGTSKHQSWKRWPTEHWKSLACGLSRRGFTVVGLGSSDERELLADICREPGTVNAAGLCSLREAAAILERCELLVCTDSGLMHIGAAVGTLIVGIFGPTDRTRTRPYGAGHTLLVPDKHCQGHGIPCLTIRGELSPTCTWQRCLEGIRPEQVLSAVFRQCRVSAD